MRENVTKTLTESRIELDEIMKTLNVLRNKTETHVEGTGRELATAYTNIQTGRMWLGEVLHDITGEYPYANTNEAKKPEDIKPAVDLSDKEVHVNENYINELGTIRKRIDTIIDKVENIVLNYYYDQKRDTGIVSYIKEANKSFNYGAAIIRLKEGRMYLGVAMGIIRDNYENKS